MIRSKKFTTNRRQAVRLPQPVTVREVEIIKLGRSRRVSPARKRWDDWFASGPWASGDFLRRRTEPPLDAREPF